MNLLTKENLNSLDIWLSRIPEEGGIALINKEKDWTSFDVVAKLRGIFRIKKTGHAGTLDPLATGLLIIAYGKSTKSITGFQKLPKTYSGKIKFGATTKTDDSEAGEENIKDITQLNIETILNTAGSFLGKIQQKPPMFSAIKVGGKRLYKLARKNIEIDVPSRTVEIHEFKILNFDAPFVEFIVKCSKGTYIRSLSRDMGEKLGTGAYLAELNRTAIGDYSVEDAVSIPEISNKLKEINKT